MMNLQARTAAPTLQSCALAQRRHARQIRTIAAAGASVAFCEIHRCAVTAASDAWWPSQRPTNIDMDLSNLGPRRSLLASAPTVEFVRSRRSTMFSNDAAANAVR
eukprot:4477430-Prymnesium_polylepis.1